jgi:hypothetical protein
LEHPLSRWIVATALSFDASSPPNPSNALRFLFHPIKQQLQKQSSSILPIIQRLLILEARFKSRIENTDGRSLDDKPLSTDFTFFESVQKWCPEDLAISITESMTRLFKLLSPDDVLRDGPHMQNISENRSNLSNNVWACLAADGNYTSYFLSLAEVH